MKKVCFLPSSKLYLALIQFWESTKMKAKTFKCGIHPPELKKTAESRISEIPLPPTVVMPLRQHIGAPLQPRVAKGDRVITGQLLADSDSFVAAPVHSSVTGTVKNIGIYPTSLSPAETCIEIETQPDEEFAFSADDADGSRLEKTEIIKRIRAAGIVGMGGAAFPTAVKLSPPAENPIDTVILNGCECEPYLTADHALMIAEPGKIVRGLDLLVRALGASRGIIGIEDNKPDALARMAEAAAGHSLISVQSLRTKYPQGAEKMLIDALLHRRVPAGGLPFHVGVIVSNVATALAVCEAVEEHKPLYSRVLTVSGDVESGANFRARVGTRFSFIFEHLGLQEADFCRIICGGPMMGVAQFSSEVPVSKATSGILLLKTAPDNIEYTCINCSACVSHCPMFLLPTRIARFARHGMWDQAAGLGAMNCIECGSCAFACPAHIPLVQWLRVTKARLQEKKSEERK